MSDNLIALISLLLLAIILIATGIVYQIIATNKLNRCTTKTVGEVSGYNARGNGVWWPIVEYEVNGAVYKSKLVYRAVAQVSGPTYKGSQITSDKFAQTLRIKRNSFFSRNPMEELFPVGSVLDVYYNPDKPKESYVQRKPKTIMPHVFLGVGFLIAALAVLMYFVI